MGFEPRQRLPVYPEFVQMDKPGILGERMREATGADGYARTAA
jgi:hypothetical protein